MAISCAFRRDRVWRPHGLRGDPGRVSSVLLDLLVPPVCAACGAPGREVCGTCRRGLTVLRDPRCARCASPLGALGAAHRCPARRWSTDAAWAAVAYAGSAPALVAALKFRGRTRVADVLAAQIASGAPPGWMAAGPPDAAVPLLVPVPTHPARRRGRGFDQAVLLARALGRRTGLGVSGALVREGPAVRQLGAGRAERLAQGRVAVRARGPAPARCLLVDDVLTTGATAEACARALRAAGAQEVRLLAWARTP